MSDESTEPKPLKLKLSRSGDAAPEAAVEAPSETASETRAPRSAQLRMRSRAERQEASIPAAETTLTPAESTAADLPVERPRPVLKRRPDAETPETKAETQPEVHRAPATAAAPSFTDLPDDQPAIKPPQDVIEEPFADPEPEPQPELPPEPEPEVLPDPEILPEALPTVSEASAPPPLLRPAQSLPTASAEENAGDAIEAAAERMEQKSETQSHSPWLSIAIIGVLLAILGGAGFGIWYLLTGPSTGPSPEEAPMVSAATPANPIDRAKAAIEAQPVAALEEALDSDTSPEPTVAAGSAASLEPVGSAAATPPAAADSSLVSAVSAYLSGVHIGGMRTTDRPMVIINGENYNAGETVDTDTGLRFTGIHNGKLAFTDKNGVIYLKSF